MLAPPPGLTDQCVADALARGWAVGTATMAYQPVGWGSHHWTVVDDAGTTWFVTVDDLDGRRSDHESTVEPAYDRLRASLSSAVALKEAGRSFVVAPIPTLDDQPLIRAGRFAVSLYPFVDGQSFHWGEERSAEHRQAVLDMLIDIHSAPMAARRYAHLDDFRVPHLGELEATLADPAAVPHCGPYAQPMADLVTAHKPAIREQIGRYNELVSLAQTSRMVLTHGEPHPGNTMRSAEGWRLIDWDTVLVAPPERDLWSLPELHAAYSKATGVDLQPDMLELYRIRWTIADICCDVSRFRRDHRAGPDEDQSWELLQENIAEYETA